MADLDTITLEIPSELTARLADLADRSGQSITDLATSILDSQTTPRMLAEFEEDERRWRAYQATGEAISIERFRARLDQMAEEARKAR